MNNHVHDSLKIFLVADESIRALACSYQPAEPGQSGLITEIFKTFDKTIEVGDYVVVETTTRHKMTVNRVEAVDVEVDVTENRECRWIVGKVDHVTYDQHKEQEKNMLSLFKKAEKRRIMESMKEEYTKGMQKEELKALTFK